MSERADFELAKRLRSSKGASLGDVFSFLSGLYFRGKFADSTHFGKPPHNVPPHYVITSDAGLMNANELLTLERLKAFGNVSIDLLEPRYTKPLQASITTLKRSVSEDCEIVLLGSVATNKYAEILVQAFGSRLLFPREFIGRGDMSRGGLLLRAVKADTELEYISLSAVESRRGPRPPKLPKNTN